MALIRTKILSDNSGYTLVETLVAMSLFALVLSLFLSVFLKVLFNERIVEQKKALHICQSNLIISSDDKSYQNGRIIVENMIVDKKYYKDGRLVTLVVTVQMKDDDKELVKLSKSFLIGK